MLQEGRIRGLLGPARVGDHLRHAMGFAEVITTYTGPALAFAAVDLGSGGGLPGLVLAAAWPESSWLLVDSRRKAGQFLAESVTALDLDRVTVVADRSETVAADEEHRGRYRVVTARSFGPPAVTAECAAPFLEPGGILVVSDPPGSSDEDGRPEDRWPVEALASLGMEPLPPRISSEGFHFRVMRQAAPCPARFPRRVGAAAKRPLF